MSKQGAKSVYIEPRRITGIRDAKIYGHFLEHFHRQIYGGIYEPGSPLSDEKGFRRDVAKALRNISPPVVRWPGGCYVSAYHWKDGVGRNRTPAFDKAWRVEESNAFGTDEYMEFCRAIGAEPYICTNAGTGTPEEMSDWVEYCNLGSEGKWARLRIENGHPQPYGVKYWSIGNENYGSWEMGAKSVGEWGRYVKESAKMMKRVDPNIQIMAASISDLDWNLSLLREAGDYLDWVSIHEYWDHLWQENNPSDYETCMSFTLEIEKKIQKTRHILGSLGYLGRIRIAFDEWNLRSWHHPHVDSGTEDFTTPRNKNDINSTYTMADAVFSACFFNECLRNCDVIGMANFAPTVNTRGIVYAHPGGIVLRPAYFVFELYTKYMGNVVVDSWMPENNSFNVTAGGKTVEVPSLHILATRSSEKGDLRISAVNRHPDDAAEVGLEAMDLQGCSTAIVYSVSGGCKDSFNDVNAPHNVGIREERIPLDPRKTPVVELPPHSVNIITFEK